MQKVKCKMFCFIFQKYGKIDADSVYKIFDITGEVYESFIKNLYIGDTVKKPGKIIKKLKQYKKLPDIYVLVCAEDNRQLEVYHSLMLQQWYYKENPPAILGIAKGQEEAFGLIEKIAQEAVAATGQADLMAYLAVDNPDSFVQK